MLLNVIEQKVSEGRRDFYSLQGIQGSLSEQVAFELRPKSEGRTEHANPVEAGGAWTEETAACAKGEAWGREKPGIFFLIFSKLRNYLELSRWKISVLNQGKCKWYISNIDQY